MITRQALLQEFQRVLYIEDIDCLDVILATALHAVKHETGDPLWIMVVGPSGSGKTQIAWESFQSLNGSIVNIDRLTPKTFSTGYARGEDLLPKLNHKLVLMKDFSSVVHMRADLAGDVFNQLRHIYDGNLASWWGGDKIAAEYEVQFNLIACVTPEALERARTFNAAMGERMIPIRMRNSRRDVAHKSIANVGAEDEVNRTLRDAMLGFLEAKLQTAPPHNNIEVRQSIRHMIANLVDLSTRLRTSVEHDYRHEIMGWPIPEFPGRVVHTLTTLARSLASVYSNASVGADEMRIIRRICYDLIQQERACILHLLLRRPMTAPEIGKLMSIPTQMARRILTDMWAIEILNCEEGTGVNAASLYSIQPAVMRALADTRILEGSLITDSTPLEKIPIILKEGTVSPHSIDV